MSESVPSKVGRYLIDRLVGAGAMGYVYVGKDPELGRAVAIKTIRDLGMDPASLGTFLERFKNEARAAARLHHPSITGNKAKTQLLEGRVRKCWMHGSGLLEEVAKASVEQLLQTKKSGVFTSYASFAAQADTCLRGLKRPEFKHSSLFTAHYARNVSSALTAHEAAVAAARPT